MKVLITGGAGFIGSYLAEALLKNNSEVAIVDDLSTGLHNNIMELKKNPKFEHYNASILDKKLMDKLINHADIIYHLAAVVGVKRVVEDPLKTIETNILGSSLILNLANKYKKRIFIASSSEVYGKSENTPLKEDTDRVLGHTNVFRWVYSSTKAIDEVEALAYHQKYNLNVTIVRFFNTVGPRQSPHYGMVIPRFVRAALKGEEIIVYGNGEQSRCFTYIKDVVKCLIKLSETEKSIGKIINIGSEEEVKINELAQMVIDLSNSKSKIKYISYDDAYGKMFEDIKKRVPDVSKLQSIIGYTPDTKLKEIILEIIRHEKIS